jgi:hypothetical protein
MVTDSPIFITAKKILGYCTFASYLLLIVVPALFNTPYISNYLNTIDIPFELDGDTIWHVIEFCAITTGLYIALKYYEVAATHAFNHIGLGRRGELYAIIYILLGIGLAIFGAVSFIQDWGAH